MNSIHDEHILQFDSSEEQLTYFASLQWADNIDFDMYPNTLNQNCYKIVERY